MVDIARPSQARKKKIRRIALCDRRAVIVVGGISLGVSKLKPAAPTVDRAVVWIDAVKRGSMLRQVRGSGTLVPEDIRWIPAQPQGRVERIVLRPGAQVTPDSVILELSNPELTQSVQEARARLQVGAGGLRQPQGGAAERAPQPGIGDVANIESQYKQAALDLEANETLYKENLISELTVEAEARLRRGSEEPAGRRAAPPRDHA